MCLTTSSFGPYFVEPVVAGLDDQGNPFVASCDLIGCPMVTSDFVVAGTASDQLSGMCEALWRPDMVSKSVWPCIELIVLDRTPTSSSRPSHSPCSMLWIAMRTPGGAASSTSCLSVPRAQCLLTRRSEKDKITTKTLKGRMD